MKRTKLLKCEPCQTPENRNEEDVTAVSQIVEADGEAAVEIDLFFEGKLRGRYFADKKNHNAWIDGKWYSCRLKNAARLCKDMEPLKSEYYYFTDGIKWASKEDKERAKDFLGTYSIDAYEESLSEKKRQKAVDRKIERIDRMMGEVPCVPDEAMEWLKQKVFPGDIMFLKKEEKRTTYSCTACGRSGWKKIGWKHGEKTVCQKCGQPVTANSRQQEKTRKATVIILQKYDQKWVERQFTATCRWSVGRKEIKLYEQIRTIIPNGKCWGQVYYGTLQEADEFAQEFYDKNPLNKRFTSSYLYPGNLQEVLKCGNLEKSGMETLAKKGEKFNVNKYITTFHRRPYLEYLAKAGLTRLAAEIVDAYGWWGDPKTIRTQATNLQEALQLDGNRVSRMKQINGGLNSLKWLQYEQEHGIKISQESLQYLKNRKVDPDDCREILNGLKSVNRMVNYMKKQKIAPGKLTTTWRDYLRMARDEGYDTTDDIVRFPRDLKARHDQLVELGNQRKDEKRLKNYAELDRQIRERLPQAARYFWENEQYTIIPAGGCEELMTEGRTLHHCVGRDDYYMKKMAAGASWILFLRKKADLEKPYYTIEIDMNDDRIKQYYSEFDRKPDKTEIDRVLEKFKQSLKRTRIRVAATA